MSAPDRSNVVRLLPHQEQQETFRPFFASELEGRQTPPLEWLVDGLLLRGTVAILAGPPKVGKCCGRGTPILMFDGSVKPVEEVKEFDILMGPDSKPRIVSGVTSGFGPLYRVIQNKGPSYVVNGDHVLSLQLSPKRKQRLFPFPVNVSVKQYLGMSTNKTHHLKGWRTGVEWPRQKVDIPPYVLGLWLGDGSKHHPIITSADPESIVPAMEEYADSVGLTVGVGKSYGQSASRNYKFGSGRGKSHAFNNSLRGYSLPTMYNLQNHKHIPREYLINDTETRLQMLAGLIDTDGHLCKSGCYEITQKSTALANDILFLARSLGFGATTRVTMKRSQVSEPRPYHRVIISGDIGRIPVKIARKVHVKTTSKSRDSLLCGIQVKPIGDGEYFGFEVNGDHLFLLGDFTVTHNSLIAQQLLTAVAIGADWLGRETVQSKSFGLFCEDPQHALERRQVAILAHYDRSPADLEADLSWDSRDGREATLIRFDGFGAKPRFTGLWDDLWAYCEEDGVNLVAIDTAAAVFDGNELSRPQVTAFLRALQAQAIRLNGVVVVTVHPNKANANGYSGSTAWLASARAGMSLARPDDYDISTGEPVNARMLRGLGSNYSAGITAERLSFEDGVFVLADPCPGSGKRGPLTHVERQDLKYRLLIGLKRQIQNGARVPADEMDARSLPARVRRSIDPQINRLPLNALYLLQHEMLEGGMLVRVLVDGRVLLRPHDGPYYQSERAFVPPPAP